VQRDVGGATAVVAGALANKVGNGGEAWVRPTWTAGLARLGFDAWLVEELAPGNGVGPDQAAIDWFRSVTAAFGLAERSALIQGDRTLVGPPLGDLAEILTDAALFVNISGHLRRSDLPTPSAARVFVDVDPGFTQVWAEQGRMDLGDHDHHVTVGTAIGTCRTPLPDNGLDWIAVLPPVLLDHWAPTPMPSAAPRFTTVGSWRPPHGAVEHDGVAYGIKAHEFRRHLELPARCPGVELELALMIHDGDVADRARLADAGFSLAEPAAVAATPAAFADHVRRSWGEWSVAQGLYVDGRTGWISDRSAHYLASGRPVVVQDTGGSLPAGEGLLTFIDVAGAAAAISEVVAAPAAHGAAARALAEEHLDSDVVLGRLCEQIGVVP
jgi:hypothetical protein